MYRSQETKRAGLASIIAATLVVLAFAAATFAFIGSHRVSDESDDDGGRGPVAASASSSAQTGSGSGGAGTRSTTTPSTARPAPATRTRTKAERRARNRARAERSASVARQRAAARRRSDARRRARTAEAERTAARAEPRARATWALAGTLQDGLAVGDPAAPATLSIYTDLRCDACIRFESTTLPKLLVRYVASGALRLRVRVAPARGSSAAERRSVRRRAAVLQAAGTHGLAINLLLAWAGRRDAGFNSPSTGLDDVEGLDAASVRREATSAGVRALVREDEARARRVGVQRTPEFLFDDGQGGAPRRLNEDQTSTSQMVNTIAVMLSG